MKHQLLVTLLLILFHGTLFAQEEKNVELIVFFPSKEKVITLTRESDSGNSTEVKIRFTVKVIPQKKIINDLSIRVNLEHFSSTPSIVNIKDETITITADELNKEQTIERDIYVELKNDALNKTYTAFIKLTSDQIDFIEKDHQRMLEITMKNPPKTTKEQEFDERMSTIQASDTIEMACLQLLTNDGFVPISYLKKGDKTGILRKVKNVTETENSIVQFKIAKAFVYIEEGRFWRITLIPSDIPGKFESTFPISATNYDKRRYDRLDYIGPKKELDSSYVSVGKVIDYLEFTSRSQFPPNATITLTTNSPIDTLRFVRNAVSFFDARIYTDPIGFSGNANGLVQTDLRAKFILNTNNSFHTTWASYLHVSCNLSKFDTKFDTLTIPSLQTRSDETILSLRKQANLNLNIDFEIFRYSGVHESVIGLGHQIALTNLQDTTGVFRRNLTPSFFLYWNGTVIATPWIRLNLMLPIYANYNYDQSFSDYEKKWNLLIVPEVEIRVDPVRKEGQKSPQGTTLFARFRYFDMPWAEGENFMQFQTGVSVPITNLFKE